MGLNKTVTISGVTLTGTAAGNYSVSPTTTTADITPYALVVTATGVNKVYDGTTNATVTLAGTTPIGLDVVTFNYAAATFANKNVGTGMQVTVTGITLGGPDGGNYLANSTATTSATHITSSALDRHGQSPVQDRRPTRPPLDLPGHHRNACGGR